MSNIYYIDLTGFFQEENVSIQDYLKLFIICDLVLDGKKVVLIEKRETGFTCVNEKLIADFYFKRFVENKSIYRKDIPVRYGSEDNRIWVSFADGKDVLESKGIDLSFSDHVCFLFSAEDKKKIMDEQDLKLYSIVDDLADGEYVRKYNLRHFLNKGDDLDRIDVGIKRVSENMRYDLYIVDGNGNEDEIDVIKKSCGENETGVKNCVVLMEGHNLQNLYKTICELNIANMLLFRKVDFYSLARLVQKSRKCYFTKRSACIFN